MRGAWRLGKVLGITVQVHWSFFIVLVWLGATQGVLAGSAVAALRGMLLVALVFATVVAHELGHALMARRFGIRTLDITLLPIGGVARLERIPEGALEGLAVALAGPAVSLAIGVGLLALSVAIFGPQGVLMQVAVPGGELSMVVQLGLTNVGLFAFNLLPAFPMDGGRALRALLVPFVGPLVATRWAAALGRGFAVVLGLLGLLANPVLVLMALFLWTAAGEEARAAEVRALLRGRTVRDALVPDVRALDPADTVQDVAGLLLHGFQQEFPVVTGGRLVGLVAQPELLHALAIGSVDLPVRAIMRDVPIIDARAGLAEALERLHLSGHRVLPVSDGGAIVGLVSVDTITRLLAVAAARADGATAPAAIADGLAST